MSRNYFFDPHTKAAYPFSTYLSTSLERKDFKNGYFTYTILKGLGPDLPADYEKDGRVEILELATFVKKEVSRLTPSQTPTLALPMGQDDFPFYAR